MSAEEAFENTVGKGEIALKDSVFYPIRKFSGIFTEFKLLSANSFSLEVPKVCCLGKDER